ncbi:MAG: helix-turn-helix transcriptional regulator [Pseudomonadota bacterium]
MATASQASALPAQRLLASGPGWRASDVLCRAGPGDRPFEEQHGSISIAAVTEGTFRYRSTSGTALLVPGSLLLGNEGHCYECGHEHGVGDRCLAFHFEPAFWEAAVAAVPGARQTVFAIPGLPPQSSLVKLLAAAEAARDEEDGAAFEELALRVAGAVLAALAEEKAKRPSTPSLRDQRRIGEALRRIEADAAAPLTLADLAREAAMSPYHFLRSFRQVVGMTPHQFVLRTRLHRAAVRLRRSDDPVSAIAFDAGFNDLSTFNRRFRRVMGMSPGAYRAGRQVAPTRSAMSAD